MTPKHPLVIAHRGGAREAPENTLAAFRRAFALGADGVECDVHLSKDGVVIVHHDPDLAVAPGGLRIPIPELSAAAIAAADLAWSHGGSFAGQCAPTLVELFAIRPAAARIMVELKSTKMPGALGEAVGRLALGVKDPGRLIFGSFDPLAVRALHRVAPRLELQAIAEDLKSLEGFQGLPLAGYALDRRLVTRSVVDDLHQKGGEVWTWTVKTESEIEKLEAAGVDALITDIPQAVLARFRP